LHNRVVLFRTKNISIVTFGLLAALGGAVGIWLILARQIQAGMHPERFAPALYLLVPALIIIGARLFALTLQWDDFKKAPLKTLKNHGFAFQGGFIGAILGIVGVAIWYQINLLQLMDTFVLGLPLGHAIGRLGCHTYGCCHGKPTRSNLAIRFTNPESKAVWRSNLAGVPLHPTQMYSVMGNCALFLFLNWIATRELSAGQLTGAYLLIGSIGRFLVEFLRGVPTKKYWGMSPFQLVAAALAVLGGVVFLIASLGPAREAFTPGPGFFAALKAAGRSFYYPLGVFAVFFVVFGIHGRRVGKPSGDES
jgi:phosphatidylglycerol:prolipoprotein diacylglycerol transferase